MTETVTVYVPPAVGVPLMMPEDAPIVKVDGNPLALQLNGVTPPAAATVVL